MQSEDRTIHFSAELIHPPAQHKNQVLQKLYFDLSQTRAGAYDSTDFTNPLQARFYSRRGPKAQSVAVFLPDRLLIVEEWADMALSEFLERVREVGTRALEARGVPRYVAHTATVRSTFALTHYDDARVFLLDHACGQEGRISPYFKRPVATGGLRFVLPETNEHPGAFHVAIESYRLSRNEVFAEVKGVFARQQAGAADFQIILDNIRQVRSFISDQVYHYLEQYDKAQVNPNG
jgi:hypothetical protein